ncbi:hypothetical protein DRE_04003 [Drechslerella stenobrocha 248]|uniref:Uncharacterized protein n=1 Tax=Drechslerella stenobrocha 248 TaxID=1043628 RepID=W7I3I8_9PEZI|nr:hypothetical protein DRE_04003 [Drechslerella stenobrocha 248]
MALARGIMVSAWLMFSCYYLVAAVPVPVPQEGRDTEDKPNAGSLTTPPSGSRFLSPQTGTNQGVQRQRQRISSPLSPQRLADPRRDSPRPYNPFDPINIGPGSTPQGFTGNRDRSVGIQSSQGNARQTTGQLSIPGLFGTQSNPFGSPYEWIERMPGTGYTTQPSPINYGGNTRDRRAGTMQEDIFRGTNMGSYSNYNTYTGGGGVIGGSTTTPLQASYGRTLMSTRPLIGREQTMPDYQDAQTYAQQHPIDNNPFDDLMSPDNPSGKTAPKSSPRVKVPPLKLPNSGIGSPFDQTWVEEKDTEFTPLLQGITPERDKFSCEVTQPLCTVEDLTLSEPIAKPVSKYASTFVVRNPGSYSQTLRVSGMEPKPVLKKDGVQQKLSFASGPGGAGGSERGPRIEGSD